MLTQHIHRASHCGEITHRNTQQWQIPSGQQGAYCSQTHPSFNSSLPSSLIQSLYCMWPKCTILIHICNQFQVHLYKFMKSIVPVMHYLLSLAYLLGLYFLLICLPEIWNKPHRTTTHQQYKHKENANNTLFHSEIISF